MHQHKATTDHDINFHVKMYQDNSIQGMHGQLEFGDFGLGRLFTTKYEVKLLKNTHDIIPNFKHCQIPGSSALQLPDTGYPANCYIWPDAGSNICASLIVDLEAGELIQTHWDSLF